jgi:hypothetical protein
MDAAHFAGFWLRHQRIGTRSTSNLFPARALRFWAIEFPSTSGGAPLSPEAVSLNSAAFPVM